MENDNITSQSETILQEPTQPISTPPKKGNPTLIEPDLEFVRMLNRQTGIPFKKCMQCGTCSATCELSPDYNSFPSKEMAWASWGMKDRLLGDPDVWLCHNCRDCSTRCPRDAKPGDLLAAVRQASIIQYAFPRFLGRWVSEPQSFLLLLGIPFLLLTVALAAKEPIETALGIGHTTYATGKTIIFSYSSMFPHWLLISFFSLFTLLSALAVIIGVSRFWGALNKQNGNPDRAKGLIPSIITTFKKIITHDNFTKCGKSAPRFWSHMSVFYGFTALSMVALWILTARINPLITSDFIYPFSFFSPWKILANLGGAAVFAGGFWMLFERLNDDVADTTVGNYFDWLLIGTLMGVVITGFATEATHYIRLEPHRHIIYFIHLVFALALIMYLPYSKLAHIAYRTVAMVFVEYTGRHEASKNPDTEGK